MIPGPCAGNVEQVAFCVIDFLQISIVADGFDAFLPLLGVQEDRPLVPRKVEGPLQLFDTVSRSSTICAAPVFGGVCSFRRSAQAYALSWWST